MKKRYKITIEDREGKHEPIIIGTDCMIATFDQEEGSKTVSLAHEMSPLTIALTWLSMLEHIKKAVEADDDMRVAMTIVKSIKNKKEGANNEQK